MSEHTILLEDDSELRLMQIQQLHYGIIRTMKMLNCDFQSALTICAMRLPADAEPPKHVNCKSALTFDTKVQK